MFNSIIRWKLFWLALFYSCASFADSNQFDATAIKNKLNHVQSDSEKVKLLIEWSFYETNIKTGIQKANEAIVLSRKINYKRGEASAMVQLAAQYRAAGNFEMALHLASKSIQLKEELGDINGLPSSYNMLGIIYKEIGDGNKAINYFKKAISFLPENETKSNLYKKAVIFGSLGRSYTIIGNNDSALFYYQRSYENFEKSKNYYQLNLALSGLGDIQFKQGNNELALGYYRAALQNCELFPDNLGLIDTYLRLTKFFSSSLNDSAQYYGEKGVVLSMEAKDFQATNEFAFLLYKSCDSTNIYSRLKWLEISRNALDSLNNREANSKINNMLLQEENRLLEREEIKRLEDEKRQSEINYLLIAVFIILFVISLPLLSNSLLVNARVVVFLSILSLLLIFEFVNLVLHQFIAEWTHHSMLFMLLSMVIIASLLIPMHGKVEKWMIKTLVTRSKRIRLMKAKKIVEKLEADVQIDLNNK